MSPTVHPTGGSAWAVYGPGNPPNVMFSPSPSTNVRGGEKVGLENVYAIAAGSPAGSLWLTIRIVAPAFAAVAPMRSGTRSARSAELRRAARPPDELVPSMSLPTFQPWN